ncbi:MAG: GntR family transcriptional regulator [Christensenellales bacterium]
MYYNEQNLVLSGKPPNLNEWAYMAIKSHILEHQIKPGMQLNIEDLSKELGISRTPIREALLRLRQEGLVISLSRVGFFVCGVTKQDFEDIFGLRKIVESHAAEQLAVKITTDELDEIIDLNQQCKTMAEQGDTKEYNRYDVLLHGTIVSSMENQKIKDIFDGIADLVYRIRVYALHSPENIRLSLLEHEKIIQAFKEKDTEDARLAMSTHISNIRDRLSHIVDFYDGIESRQPVKSRFL